MIRFLPCLAASVALAITAYTAKNILQAYPFSHDEYTYLYQATLFAHGQLGLAVPEWMRPLVEPCMVWARGIVFSKYPPGFSLLLSLGVLLHAPWIITPLLSAITVGILCMGICREHGWLSALLAVALLVSSPLFIGYGGSFFAQPLSLCCVAAGFESIRRLRHGDRSAPIIGSLACGVLVLVRPVDALCLTIALGAALFFADRELRARGLLMLCAAVLSSTLLLLLFNFSLTGMWSLSVAPVWVKEFHIIDPQARDWLDNLSRIWNYYRADLSWFTWPAFIDDYLPLLGPAVLICAAAGALVAPCAMVIPAIVFIVCIVGLYGFHPYFGNPLYGARYWYPTFVPLILLSGYAIRYLLQRRYSWGIAVIFLAVIATQAGTCLQRWEIYRERIGAMQELRATMERECPAHSVVILGGLPNRLGGWPPFVEEMLLKRNPFLQGDRLFVSTDAGAQEVADHMPGYTVCDVRIR